MSLIDDEEIFARVHKYKIFRSEGNLFIDVYEAMLGKPAHKFMAVPNLLIQEAKKEYFGVGDSQKEALKDCLKKIKGVPIDTIVPLEEAEGPDTSDRDSVEGDQESRGTPLVKKLTRKLLGRREISPSRFP